MPGQEESSNKKTPRFGVILLPYSVSYQRLAEAALHAESLGFDSLWIPDHIQRGTTPILECWTTISALSALTRKVRIGSLATCNSFRNPGLLAKMVATASLVSKGRVELAIGIGYDEAEFKAAGIRFPPFKERVERLDETLQIVRSLWTEKTTNFEGRYWNFKDAVCEPKPVGLPRIWVAGRNKELIRVAAKQGAYGMNILPYSGTLDRRRISSIDELKEISQEIAGAGIEHKSMYCGDGGLVVGIDGADYAKRVERAAAATGLAVKKFGERISNLSIMHGTIEQVSSSIKMLASLGFEELMIIFPGWQEGNYENMDLFAKEFVQGSL
ncbi:MAG TPA: LLM class flavin-dependent oxidoreductase [Nitrososphaerales archaeon]|nr:LLM class flavin-dependent oxidoreductase [Nitrososphaerales archaeon]